MGKAGQTNVAAVLLASIEPSRLDGNRQWIHLLNPGVNRARDGRVFNVGDPARVVAASLAWAGGSDLPIDYDHQIYRSEANGKPALAAGWIKTLEVREGGSIWAFVEWTERAAAMIRAKEYRYISPAIKTKEPNGGEVLCIYNAALINTPALDLVALASAEGTLSGGATGKAVDGRLAPRAAQAPALPRTPAHFLQTTFNDEGTGKGERGDAFDRLAALATERPTARERPSPMSVSPAILAALDLPAEADEQAVLDAIDALRVRAEDAIAPAALGAMTALMTELGTDRQKFHAERVEAKIEKAMRDGVILPALKEWATALCTSDEAAFDGFVAKVGAPFASLFEPVITPEMEAKLTAEVRGGHPAAPGLKGRIAHQLGIDTKALD